MTIGTRTTDRPISRAVSTGSFARQEQRSTVAVEPLPGMAEPSRCVVPKLDDAVERSRGAVSPVANSGDGTGCYE